MVPDIYDDDYANPDNVSIDEAIVDSEEDAERFMGVALDTDDEDPNDLDGDGDPDIYEV
ncbi:MAG: hypothetical protein LBT99_00140 [Bifidobacteriaceae bacterium]|jgi:hypothetical protein|nr:hypothetical protein [Bifidobacteriaceae bacterium]